MIAVALAGVVVEGWGRREAKRSLFKSTSVDESVDATGLSEG